MAVTCDVTVESDVGGLVGGALSAFGRVDLLVSNAGLWAGGFAENEDPDEFRHVLDVNLTGLFLCCRRAGRVMLEKGAGVIINIARSGRGLRVQIPRR